MNIWEAEATFERYISDFLADENHGLSLHVDSATGLFVATATDFARIDNEEATGYGTTASIALARAAFALLQSERADDWSWSVREASSDSSGGLREYTTSSNMFDSTDDEDTLPRITLEDTRDIKKGRRRFYDATCGIRGSIVDNEDGSMSFIADEEEAA